MRPDDRWEPTLDELNGRTYDYVKLHRMSGYLDIGIAPYSLGICFDGTLVLPGVALYQDRSKALTEFNRALSELLLGGLYCEAVSPDDVGYGSTTLTGYTRISGGAVGAASSLHIGARTKHIGTIDVIKLLKPEVVTMDFLEKSRATGRKLLASLENLPSEQVLYGATFYVRKQWAESLIHIWTTTERIIEIAWQKHILAPQEPLSQKRRSFLEDHRTWSTATKLEVLFQKNLLPLEIYEQLDLARKARNDLAHRGIAPNHEVALTALKGCFELASLCASEFSKKSLFEPVINLIIDRCDPRLFPEKNRLEENEVSHWLDLPPIPGDARWGDREYEVIEDLLLKPINKA
jgi:hypothetical protein